MSLDVWLTAEVTSRTEVFDRNITHNLNTMAEAAGIYKELWRPDELGITKAGELIPALRKGLTMLQKEPERFIPMNPPNGWGKYENLVDFVETYLDACIKYPDADVRVSR